MKTGTCLVCFVENVKVFDIASSQLQCTYELISDISLGNISLYLCYICHTRLKQFSDLFKQIGEQYMEDQTNELEGQFQEPLSSHIIENGSIPYHVDFNQDLVTTIKKEASDVVEEIRNCKQKQVAKTKKTKTTHTKKPKKLRKRATNKLFICNVCNKKYGRSDHLKLHKTCHSNDTPYSCDICKKNFKRKSNLKDHMKTHTNDKPHKCDVCSRTFLKGSNLKAHKLTHTSEKPFGCDICNRTFNRKSHLTIHQRTHTGNKPYQCQTCKQSFSRSDHLRSHQKVHTHDEDIFTCHDCEEIFIYKHHLKMHILKTHLRI